MDASPSGFDSPLRHHIYIFISIIVHYRARPSFRQMEANVMTPVDKDLEIEKLRALNKRLYYYVAALLVLAIVSIVVNLRNVM